LDDRQLRRRLDWALAQPWVDEATRGLLGEGRQWLDTTATGSAAEETHDVVPAAATKTAAIAAEAGREVQPPPDMSAAHVNLGQLGEYALLEKLGEGGMGTVYKARHAELDRLVAIKVLRKGYVEEDWAVARFRREIKAVGQLDHPHIVRAYDARKIADTHFLVMEYVDGLDLNELVDCCGPLPTADACELVRQAALGLQCAHEHGLVHRDIKPPNLMLNRQGQVKILDLGLVRVRAAGGLSGEMTAVGQVMGTPDYMAPEQVSDSHAIDIRADIYSLGCTLYKLLTGRAPFSGPQYQSLLAKMTAHNEQTPPPVGQFRNDVPAELRTVLDRMLAKAPEQRFATPAEVAGALDHLARGSDLRALLAKAEGKAADSGSVAVHAGPGAGSVRGRPSWAVAASLAVLVLAGGIAWMLWGRTGEQGGGAISVSTGQGAAAGPGQEGNSAAGRNPAALPGWIVLSWTRPRMGKPNLWLFRPDGKRRVNITNDPRVFDIHPKFSPDGRRIAFIRGEGLNEPNSVCVCNADGSRLRPLVAPRNKSERFASPVWVSNSRIYYARDPKFDREPDMEVWQVDLDGGNQRLVFRFQDAVGKGDGLVTDVSPDGRLAIIAQSRGLPSTSDVYVTDPEGKKLQTVWVDNPDEWKDARALWSPDGTRIAWHHNFTRGMLGKPIYHGVGMARWETAGKWNARLQPDPEVFVTPLAWSPRGDSLLCARLRDTGQKLPPATLYLTDEHLRSVRDLFELEACPWQPAQRDLGRLADWAVVPEDVLTETEP
jgi:Tol biopolymer transport system component/tRNA A-37 threonylcarbamoyl transferase component Bud32